MPNSFPRTLSPSLLSQLLPLFPVQGLDIDFLLPMVLEFRFLHRSGVLLDVSLASRFEKKSAKGSINIPLYQPIEGSHFRKLVCLKTLFEGWDVPSIARRVAFAFFGIPGTERNPDWLEDVESTIPKDKEVVVLCELGGTLEKKAGMDTGFQSRFPYYYNQIPFLTVLSEDH